MKRVVILAYYFPPDGGAGTQRIAKFCKYLPRCGWQPIVVTRTPDAERGRWNPEDPGLLEEIGSQTCVIRTRPEAAEADWTGALPNIDIGRPWLNAAFEAARRAIQTYHPDTVLITMSPFDLCYVGQRLQSDCHVPVVLDLRDPWALDGWRLHGTRRRWQQDFAAMVQALSSADGVIANTATAATALCDAVPKLMPSRVATIPNGFDAADFRRRAVEAASRRDDSDFRLVHVGTLHCETLYRYEGLLGRLRRLKHYRPEPIDPSGRTPLHLLRAMRLLREGRHPLGRRLRLVLVGQIDDATSRCVRESGLEDRVEMTGYVSHVGSVAQLLAADALFLPLHGLPPGRRSLIVPGKAYEYLASGRPILACLPPGDTRDLVEQSGRGFCADPCDPAQIASALAGLYGARSNGLSTSGPDLKGLERFERAALTHDLAAFLEQVSLAAQESIRRPARMPEIAMGPSEPGLMDVASAGASSWMGYGRRA